MRILIVLALLLPVGATAQFHSFAAKRNTKQVSLYYLEEREEKDNPDRESFPDPVIVRPIMVEPKKNNKSSLIAISPPLQQLRETSGFGYRKHPILKKWRMHKGVDLAARKDTVFSVLDGEVTEAGYNSGLGYYMRIRHAEGLNTLYAHLSQYYYKKGYNVKAGEPIGLTGSTGMTTGEHLHFGVYNRDRAIDPIDFLTQILNYNNTMKEKTSKESALEKLRQIAQSEEAVPLSKEESEFLTIEAWDDEELLREEEEDE